jgi:hypothetical protein
MCGSHSYTSTVVDAKALVADSVTKLCFLLKNRLSFSQWNLINSRHIRNWAFYETKKENENQFQLFLVFPNHKKGMIVVWEPMV